MYSVFFEYDRYYVRKNNVGIYVPIYCDIALIDCVHIVYFADSPRLFISFYRKKRITYLV